MVFPKLQTVESPDNLRDRVERLLKESPKSTNNTHQLSLDLNIDRNSKYDIDIPCQSISAFLDFITDSMPDGDVYLFGGILRDLALFGRKGFNSDIDLVVEGDWSNLVPYLHHLNAHKNKFGGYRFMLCKWPIDIWNARETWAIKQGIVPYNGIVSLTNTTVLNWDAILMNWRTKKFICRHKFFEEINLRVLDIVLQQNPNPMGMAVRVFRHLCLKDAKKITPAAARYLANSARSYSFEKLRNAELKSYRESVILREVHRFFEHIDLSKNESIHHQFSIARSIMEKELGLTI